MIRSPFLSELFSLHDSINQAISPFATPNGSTRVRVASVQDDDRRQVRSTIPLDVYATDDQAVIVAAVPGVHPEDIELTVQKNTVTLSGTVRGGNIANTDDAPHVTWYVSEIGRGSFRRTVTLPFAIDEAKAEAQFANGMLRLTLPRVEAAKPHRISVKVSSQPATELSATVGSSSNAESTSREEANAD